MTTPRAASSLLGFALWALVAPASADCAGAVYLTLDTGDMSQAETIAKILNEEGIKATFFIANERSFRGDRALDASWADFWRARVAEGHVFGNHTWSHSYQRRDLDNGRIAAITIDGKPVTFDQQQFCAELQQVDTAFDKLTGHHLSGLWRAPGGRTTQNSIRWAASCGYPVYVGWSETGYLGDDWPSEKYSNAALLERAEKSTRPGDILLMHLGIHSRKQPFAPELKPLIEHLKARGLCFGTLAAGSR
ncbi:MAG: polysaccharide deacetylase family protein [Bacteroidota bacterium]